MMERMLGVSEARKDLGDLVEKVQYQGNSFLITRRGVPAAAVVPVQVYEYWKEQREQYFDQIRDVQQAAQFDPLEAEKLAGKAIASVRAHRAR
jgi:prevent-host-death family protein